MLTVGQLRALLQDLPDEMPVAAVNPFNSTVCQVDDVGVQRLYRYKRPTRWGGEWGFQTNHKNKQEPVLLLR